MKIRLVLFFVLIFNGPLAWAGFYCPQGTVADGKYCLRFLPYYGAKNEGASKVEKMTWWEGAFWFWQSDKLDFANLRNAATGQTATVPQMNLDNAVDAYSQVADEIKIRRCLNRVPQGIYSALAKLGDSGVLFKCGANQYLLSDASSLTAVQTNSSAPDLGFENPGYCYFTPWFLDDATTVPSWDNARVAAGCDGGWQGDALSLTDAGRRMLSLLRSRPDLIAD